MQPPVAKVPSRLGQEKPASTEMRCTRQPKTRFNSAEKALYLFSMDVEWARPLAPRKNAALGNGGYESSVADQSGRVQVTTIAEKER
jgi:hypothetical protein